MPDTHKDAPDPIDIAVGARIRRRRLELKVSQEKLAGAIGVTFQQVQKYERGTNRVSASMLAKCAKELEAPINYFFADVEGLGGTIESDAAGTRFLALPAGRKLAAAFVHLTPHQQTLMADTVVGLTA